MAPKGILVVLTFSHRMEKESVKDGTEGVCGSAILPFCLQFHCPELNGKALLKKAEK